MAIEVKNCLRRFLKAACPGNFWALLLAVTVMTWQPAGLDASDPDPPDLFTLSLEELMEIEITSVAKKPQKLSQAAAAVFVVTAEDIRRSGATSIPEALRMVPGMEVARIDANKWAISCRGFNGRFANKLLVLMDGRSVYAPLFSGVFWHIQDTMMEDIDRIEIIRGPGASLWGANAVNGVVNIITKPSQATQGTILSAGAGTGSDQGSLGLRYGGTAYEKVSYRIYAKYLVRDHMVDPPGMAGPDSWDMWRAGFRADWELSDRDLLTLQGDLYDCNTGNRYTSFSFWPPYEWITNGHGDFAGGNLVGRWNHSFSLTSDTSLQLYYDQTEMKNYFSSEYRYTFDVDFQHRFGLGTRQEVIWGLGYRFTQDDLEADEYVPESSGNHLFSAFVQNEITLVEDRLALTLGSKFEHNDFSGFEFQPNGRLLWTPHPRHTLWTSVSRAVRTPTRAEMDILRESDIIPPGDLYPGSPTILTVLVGNDDFKSAELLSLEFGHRFWPTSYLSVDTATFYNIYDNLRSVKALFPSAETLPTPHLRLPLSVGNRVEGNTYGLELAADWRVRDWWRLRTAYTFLQMQLTITPLDEGAEGKSPHNQFSLRSTMDLPWDLEFDAWLRWVDGLPTLDVADYVSLDVRIGWRPTEYLELSLVGQNLMEDHRPEYATDVVLPIPCFETERGVYGTVTWRF